RRGLALAGEPQRLTIVDSRRHRDRQRRRLRLEPAPAALRAWILDRLARAAALRTRGLHHEEALRVHDLALALTRAAHLGLAAGGGTARVARGTRDVARDLDVFRHAPHGLGERQLEIDAEIRAARLPRATATTAEEIAEQIA